MWNKRAVTAVLSCFAVNVVVFSGAWHLPTAAGHGELNPRTSVFLFYFARWIPALVGFFAVVLLSLRKEKTVRWNAHFVIAFITVVSFLGHITLLTPHHRDTLFLSAFANHCATSIGARNLESNAQAIRHMIDSGKMRKARLAQPDFPSSWNSLYKSVPIQGLITYGPGDTCQRLVIYWGGNLFKWGIEIDFSENSLSSPVAKRMSLPIETNILCFIEK